ncbi:MAG: tRNA glutamyl-Q(34) synthetase GluQRS, partial [Oscillospiraceae bacterium]|nr:tRNA glutamyl-Q(34) synthetase GluQRS [Oscillospiraceae bacterium]
HLGNVFSALLAWLSVRSQNGQMILRLEDLDPDRCKAEYCEQLKNDLAWLGLNWDTEQTPQSRRTDAYCEQFEKLHQLGLVYPCYCTRAELHAASAPHASDGNVIYAGTCRDMTEEQRKAQTRNPAWRLRATDETLTFTDGLQGKYEENLAKDCGDFILRRSDGVYAYQLAVVTDDAAGGVNEVVRGQDLLTSTPRQMYLQRLLGFAQPTYYHVPLLLAPDGRRLSKRERDLDMGALREAFRVEDLIGHLAHLAGLLEKPQSVSAQELVGEFSWARVKKTDICMENTPFL